MKILDKCTYGFWKQNKVKLFSVIFCMILSVSLLMSLFLTFGVFSSSLIKSRKTIYGDYMVNISDISRDDADSVRNSEKISNSFYTAPVGFVPIDSNDPVKRYIMVLNAESGFTENMPVNLLMGRMPENENEIILPNHIGDKFKINDNISLELGKRSNEEGILDTYEQFLGYENVVDSQIHEYTVVGFYERAIFEDSIFPAYIAITTGEKVSENGNLYVSLSSPYSVHSFVNNLKYKHTSNQDLLSCYGINLNFSHLDLAQLFMIIILLLILIVMIMLFVLNKNIINISLGEKRQKLCIRLNQLGVVKKELYLSSIKESAVLSLISLPFSVAIGIAGTKFIVKYLEKVTSIEISDISFNVWFILVSVLLISVFAMIAQMGFINNTFKKSHTNKVPKIYKPLAKNSFEINLISKKYITNNKKQKRSMIATIAVSVTMFVSFSCVCSDLNQKNELYESTIPSDIVFDYYSHNMNSIESEELFYKMRSFNGVTESNYIYCIDADDNIVLMAFEDGYFKSQFNDMMPVFIDTIGDISANQVSGNLTFTREVPIGEVTEGAVTKFETETRNYSFEYSAVKAEDKNYLGLNAVDEEDSRLILIYPYSVVKEFFETSGQNKAAHFFFNVSDKADANMTFSEMFGFFNKNGYSSNFLKNNQTILQEEENNYYLIKFFSSVFTIFIFIITLFNLLNITLSNIKSRVSDYVILYSLGTNKRDIQHMSVYESIYYQIRGMLWSIIPTLAICIGGYFFVSSGKFSPYIPIKELLICLLVFIVINMITVIMAVTLLEKDKIVGYLKDKSL